MQVHHIVVEAGQEPDQSQSALRIVDLVCLHLLVSGNVDNRSRHSGSPQVLTESHQVGLNATVRRRIWSEQKNLHGAGALTLSFAISTQRHRGTKKRTEKCISLWRA